MQLDGPRLEPRNGKAKSLVLLLHGVAAQGANLLDLAHALQTYLPDTLLLAPDAPFPYDDGPVGFQWFSLQDRMPDVLLAGLQEAAALLNGFADQLLSHLSLPPEGLAFVGFSQGAALALFAGLRHSPTIAGAVSFCGALPDTPALQDDIPSKPPLLLIEGEADEVVPFEAQARTGSWLEAVGLDVETVVRPDLGHAIDAEGIARAGAFLQRVLANGRPSQASV